MAMLTVRESLGLLDVPQSFTAEGVPAQPLRVVDLATAPAGIQPEELADRLGTRPQVTVGVLPGDPSPQALRLAVACTLTLCQASREEEGWPFTVPVDDVDAALETLEQVVHAQPTAAVSLHQLLHVQAGLAVPAALVAESATYSTLLGGSGFARWLTGRPPRRPSDSGTAVELTVEAGTLRIFLSRPQRRNAFNAAMRDALADALTVAAADPSLRVELHGRGPDFCAGGDLDEFGTTPDPATGHVLRIARSAGLGLHRVADRTTAYLHGNCVGAGIELPSFVGRVVARPGTRFRLPELAMGLIPGAGGTVSLARRIGRWRTAWLALTGVTLDVESALSWGLVDEISPA
ncbi:enoyl-CoA hydratase/isomerase family protein [Acrocarpospora catenulata]|uniref:enoyl-CoA hydratase/isomerase family protein n=1 Tax=Acrocarpospora catenulata TaxID=2836182 RepID=UPI001BDABF81|nr:enoyl-CoA hydratase/isomerase family protein [Acrocarpospora catenulata]